MLTTAIRPSHVRGSTEKCCLVWGLEDRLQYGRDAPRPSSNHLAWSYNGRYYAADLVPDFHPEAPAAQAELARACDLLFAPGAPVHEEYLTSPASRPACLMGQLREVATRALEPLQLAQRPHSA